jgi:hypothetical protein
MHDHRFARIGRRAFVAVMAAQEDPLPSWEEPNEQRMRATQHRTLVSTNGG